MHHPNDLDQLISGVLAVLQADNTTNQATKDTACNVVMLIGILLKDMHRIADAIDKIAEEI